MTLDLLAWLLGGVGLAAVFFGAWVFSMLLSLRAELEEVARGADKSFAKAIEAFDARAKTLAAAHTAAVTQAVEQVKASFLASSVSVADLRRAVEAIVVATEAREEADHAAEEFRARQQALTTAATDKHLQRFETLLRAFETAGNSYMITVEAHGALNDGLRSVLAAQDKVRAAEALLLAEQRATAATQDATTKRFTAAVEDLALAMGETRSHLTRVDLVTAGLTRVASSSKSSAEALEAIVATTGAALEDVSAASKKLVEVASGKTYNILQSLADDAVTYAEQCAKTAKSNNQPAWTNSDKKAAALSFLREQAKTQGVTVDDATCNRAIEAAIPRTR
jgi:hypothetical protein